MAKKQETKEEQLAVPQSGAMAIPDFMKGKAGLGAEKISAADVEIPRLKLLQALNPEVQEGGHRQGHFFHTIAEKSLGSEVSVVFVYTDKSYILWRPRKTGGGILARAMDGIHWSPPDATFEVMLDDQKTKVTWKTALTVAKSGLGEWGTMDPNDPKSPPAATMMRNLAIVLPEYPELSPVVVTLQRAGIRVARKLMGKITMMTQDKPLFGLKFKMHSFQDSSPAGAFFNYAFTADGLVEDETLFQFCAEKYEVFKSMGLKIRDVEGIQTEGADIPGAAPADVSDKM